MHAASVGALGLALCLGCTRVSDEERFETNPEPLRIVATVPAAGAQHVAANARIDVCFSALVDPRPPDETDAVIASGQTLVDTELDLQLVPWQAPGSDRPDTGEKPWCEGSVLSVTPKIALEGGVLYRMRLRPTVHGWHGETLDTEQPGWITDDEGNVDYFLELTVATDDPAPLPGPAPAVTLRDLFASGGPFDPARALCSCHLDPDDLAHALLDLRTPEAAFEALLGSSRLRDTGFSMVSPREPAQSFFVHKLLRDDDGDPLRGVLGDAMPPDDPLPWPDLQLVLRWINDGATL